MTIKYYTFFIFVSTFLLFNNQYALSQNVRRPNIIFILADDLGYGNLSSYNPNSPIKTPNIDQLAAEGTKFSRFYSGSTVCAPSRGSLMTGRHTGTAYIRGNTKGKDGKGALRKKDITVAEILQRGGYKTGMFGKWGLGDIDSEGAPHLKGFDSFFGYLDQSHAHDYYTDSLYQIRNGSTEVLPVKNTSYTQDLIAQRAMDFIRENKERNFFLYLPFTLPHAELIVPDSLLREFQKPDGSSVFGTEKPFRKRANYDSQTQPHAAFAAMITKLDSDVGRIMALINDLGLQEDTYIFFSSDNGPHHEGGADPAFFNSGGPLRGIKRDLYEGGIRVPFIAKVPGKTAPGSQVDDPWAFWDLLPTWVELANMPNSISNDGISFVPTLTKGRQSTKHRFFYWQFNENGVLKEALIEGKWKLIRFKEKGRPERLELYDLDADIGEREDLSRRKPSIVQRLKKQIEGMKQKPENPTFDWSDMEF